MIPPVKPLNLSFLSPSKRKLHDSLSGLINIVSDPNGGQDPIKLDSPSSQRMKIETSSQREQLLSERKCKESITTDTGDDLKNIALIAKEKESKFNSNVYKSLMNFKLPPFATPDELEQIAKQFCEKSIDTWCQEQILHRQSEEELDQQESPRAKNTLMRLQHSGLLTEKVANRVDQLRNHLFNYHERKNQKSEWSLRVYTHCKKILLNRNHLQAFVDCFDPKNMNDLQMQQIFNHALGTDKAIQVMRSWSSPESSNSIRPQVENLFHLHRKREIIPCRSHNWIEFQPKEPLDLISAKVAAESFYCFMAEQFHTLMVNRHKVDCTSLTFDHPFPEAFWIFFFQIIQESGFKGGDVVEEARCLLDLQSGDREKLEKHLKNRGVPHSEILKMNENKIFNFLIPYKPLLQIASRGSWEACEKFMSKLFPDLFAHFSLQEIKTFTQSECYIKIENNTSYSVTQERLYEICLPTAPDKRLGVARFSWTVFPFDDKDAKWQGNLKVCDIFIDQTLCDFETKWKILNAFIKYQEPSYDPSPKSSPVLTLSRSSSSGSNSPFRRKLKHDPSQKKLC